MQFSLVEMWRQMGWPARSVVLVLLVMSIYFVAIAIERLIKFSAARSLSLSFVIGLRDKLRARDLRGALALSKVQPQSPIARVVACALDEYAEWRSALGARGGDDLDAMDAVQRAIERTREREVADLRRGLSGLATIASSAPFVGLLGTVMGIITAFQKMASEGGGLNAVAGGISEALVTTAFGLLVAIPSVMVFNYFTNRVDEFIVDMNDVASELTSFVTKDGRAPAAQAEAVAK